MKHVIIDVTDNMKPKLWDVPEKLEKSFEELLKNQTKETMEGKKILVTKTKVGYKTEIVEDI